MYWLYSLPKLEKPLYKVSILGKICIRLIPWSTSVIKVNSANIDNFKTIAKSRVPERTLTKIKIKATRDSIFCLRVL